MNGNLSDKKMGERRAESGEQGAAPAASPSPLSQKASSLITTLLVLVVLSTIVVAFMQSMSVERSVAKSSKNKYQADLAAEAAMQEFLTRLYVTKESGPYSAIYVPNTNANPYLFLARREFQANATITRRIPLFSTFYTNFDSLTNFAAPFQQYYFTLFMYDMPMQFSRTILDLFLF